MKHLLASLFVIFFLVSTSVSGGELRTSEGVQPPPWAGQYRYDGAGNIKAIGTNQYVYDGAGRLITATMTAGVRAYTYDEFGNLVRVVSNGDGAHAAVAGVNRATNRIDDATPCTPGTTCIIASFDDAGNQITGPAGAQYQYDPLNMMTELSAVARHDIYIYDADDQRIATVNDAGAASRVWHYTLRDGSANVIREWDDSVSGTTHTWTWTKDYVHRDTSLLATVAPSETSEIRTHFHLDHLGTPRLLTDDLGRKVSIHTYWPFGQETPDSDLDAETRKLTGHERDFAGLGNVNDLDYMHARFYAPVMGRFLSVDPIEGTGGEPQSWNRYVYATDDPLLRVDPDGRADCPAGTEGVSCFTYSYSADPKSKFSEATLRASAERSTDATDRAYALLSSGIDSMRTLRYLRPTDFYSNQVTLHGLEAFADGVIPDVPGCGDACDPFASHGLYDVSDPGMRSAQVIGVLTRDAELTVAGLSSSKVSGGGTWLNKGRYFRAGESFTKGKTWFALRGQWVDRLTGQTAKHVYLWILRNGR